LSSVASSLSGVIQGIAALALSYLLSIFKLLEKHHITVLNYLLTILKVYLKNENVDDVVRLQTALDLITE